jgi:nucleotide-binding universal stress UspA family protein
MNLLPKSLLLPVDGTEEALRPVDFVTRLYPDKSRVTVILSYFKPAVAPVYEGKLTSSDLIRKRQDILKSRKDAARSALDEARKKLLQKGFSNSVIEEHVEEKPSNAAKGTCLLASRKKVDAVLLQKRMASSLEHLFQEEFSHAVLDHCRVSPLWLTEGQTRTGHAAICINKEEASLRAADHAAFMLGGTDTHVTLLHAAQGVSHPVTCRVAHLTAELEKWLITPEGRELKPFLMEAHQILLKEDIPDEKIHFTAIPAHGRVTPEILSHCRLHQINIVVLGHSPPTGIWGFLKGSVTRKMISELKDMTAWISL